MKSEDIRHHKGKSFVGVTTSSFCHDGNSRYFLNKRSNKARDERGVWDTCGGGLKAGITAEENVIREVQEEYGATPLEVKALGYREMFRVDHDGTPTHWISLDFLVKLNPAHAKNNEPEMFTEVGWFKIKDFPEPRHSQMNTWLEKYKDVLDY